MRIQFIDVKVMLTRQKHVDYQFRVLLINARVAFINETWACEPRVDYSTSNEVFELQEMKPFIFPIMAKVISTYQKWVPPNEENHPRWSAQQWRLKKQWSACLLGPYPRRGS